MISNLTMTISLQQIMISIPTTTMSPQQIKTSSLTMTIYTWIILGFNHSFQHCMRCVNVEFSVSLLRSLLLSKRDMTFWKGLWKVGLPSGAIASWGCWRPFPKVLNVDWSKTISAILNTWANFSLKATSAAFSGLSPKRLRLYHFLDTPYTLLEPFREPHSTPKYKRYPTINADSSDFFEASIFIGVKGG